MDDEEVCTVQLYYDGEVSDTHYAMPKRMPAQNAEATEGLGYTIVGLEPGTTYKYILQTYDSDDILIDSQSGTFTTPGIPQAEEEEESEDNGNDGKDDGRDDHKEDGLPAINTEPNIPVVKILRGGQIYILRGEKIYTVTGQEVK